MIIKMHTLWISRWLTWTCQSHIDDSIYYTIHSHCYTYTCCCLHNIDLFSCPVGVPERPEITGFTKPAMEGDLITLTCTTSGSKPAAHIQWFRNDKEVQGTGILQYSYFFWRVKHDWGGYSCTTTTYSVCFTIKESWYTPLKHYIHFLMLYYIWSLL